MNLRRNRIHVNSGGAKFTEIRENQTFSPDSLGHHQKDRGGGWKNMIDLSEADLKKLELSPYP